MELILQVINAIAPYWINSLILLAISFVVAVIIIAASQISKAKKKSYTGVLFILAFIAVIVFDIISYATVGICLCRIIQFFL